MSAHVSGGGARADSAGGELVRMLASWAWVLVAAVGSLAVLGSAPRWLAGDGLGVRHAGSIAEAERRLGARVLVPGYYPARLGWPPARIEVAGGRRGSVLLEFAARDGGPGVALLQSTLEGEPIAEELLEDRTVLRSRRTTVGAVPATISDVLAGGKPEVELAWEIRGRAMILRSAGDLEDLFHMARSSHREGGR